MDIAKQYATNVFILSFALIGVAIVLGKIFKKSNFPAYIAITGMVLLPYSVVFGFGRNYSVVKIVSTIAVAIIIPVVLVRAHRIFKESKEK